MTQSLYAHMNKGNKKEKEKCTQIRGESKKIKIYI
jgi:hypothetical protein